MNTSTTLATLAVLFAVLPPGLGQSTNSHSAEVHRLAQPLVDGGLVPGLVVGLYDAGHLETYGLGAISQTNSATPDADTVYEIGSMTKVFTGLLLADAITRGEVTLDTPLNKLLPTDVKSPKFDGHEITLEQLATHFSGLPRIPDNMDGTTLDNPYAGYGREKLFKFLNGYELTRAPGAEYEYSNLGMGLLGTLLADRAGTNYESLLKQRITQPLHMDDTTLQLTPGQQRRLAPPHRGGVRVSNWDFDALAGCGAVRSTVNDMLKLVAAQADPAASPLNDTLTLAAQRRQSHTGGMRGIGLGWQIAGDRSTLWHNGQTGGYFSAVFVNAGLKKGVVVLANGTDSAVDALGEKLIQSLAGMKVQPAKVRPAIAVPVAQLARLTGEYALSDQLTFSITRQDDALFAQLTGQASLHVFAESPTRFFYREVEAELQFELDPKTGRATAVTLFQNGQEIRCPRKP
jgi:serine-type D-Ala-D-Ala carboxypeptidase/endopeptidase